MEQGANQLNLLLEDAFQGKAGAVRSFFEALMKSQVFVPVKADTDAFKGMALVGEGQEEVADLISIIYEGKKTIPIFTHQEFVHVWATKELPVAAKEFKTLLWSLGDETSLYLNPCQEYGKEITAWEIERLKGGAETFAELVSEIDMTATEDITVSSGEGQLYVDLRDRLTSIVSSYDAIDEMFLLAVRFSDSEDERPLIGVNQSGLDDDKLSQLHLEFSDCFADTLPSHLKPIVIDDLERDKSPYKPLFRDETPFYIRQKTLADISLWGRMKKLFGA